MDHVSESANAGDRGWTILACGAAAFACALVGGGVLVSQRFEAVFRDLGVRVPLATEWALRPLSHAVAALVLVAAAVVMGVGRAAMPFVVLACVYAALLAYVLFAPLNTIMTGLATQT